MSIAGAWAEQLQKQLYEPLAAAFFHHEQEHSQSSCMSTLHEPLDTPVTPLFNPRTGITG